MSIKEVTDTLPLLTMFNTNSMTLPVSDSGSNVHYGVNTPKIVPKNRAVCSQNLSLPYDICYSYAKI